MTQAMKLCTALGIGMYVWLETCGQFYSVWRTQDIRNQENIRIWIMKKIFSDKDLLQLFIFITRDLLLSAVRLDSESERNWILIEKNVMSFMS